MALCEHGYGIGCGMCANYADTIAHLRAELADARRERDERPAISRPMARGFLRWFFEESRNDTDQRAYDDAVSILDDFAEGLDIPSAHATGSGEGAARLRELKRQLAEAGDRHDRDDCDRIEAEIERIEKGEASGGVCWKCGGSCVEDSVRWDMCTACNGTWRAKGER